MIALGLIAGTIDLGIEALTVALLFFLGVAQLPIIGVAYSFCAEITYPVNEAMSCGMLQLFGSVVAAALTFAVGYLLENEMRYPAVFLMIGFVVFGAIVQLFVREILRRKRAGLKSSSFSFNIGNHGQNEAIKGGVQNASDPLSHPTTYAPLMDDTE